MTYQPLTIANMKTGLEKDMDSFLTADDAFQVLENAYLWRGRIYTKGGTQLLGRLGVRQESYGTRTPPNQIVTSTVLFPPIEPASFTITDGITTFTDNGLGVMVVTAGAGLPGVVNYTTGVFTVTFTGANPGAAITGRYLVIVNNSSPVMGLRQFEVGNPVIPGLMAFDMVRAYNYNTSTNQFDNQSVYKATTNTVAWTGSNSDFFYSSNFQYAFFATNNTPGLHAYAITNITNAANAQITIGVNNLAIGDMVYINNVIGMTGVNNTYVAVTAPGNPVTVNLNTIASGAYGSGGVLQTPQLSKAAGGDGIRWWDGLGWVNFEPILDSNAIPQILQGALLVIPYKGYLVVLNTLEGPIGVAPQRFIQRARWSQQIIGGTDSIYYSLPLPNGLTLFPNANPLGNEWYSIPGKGGFLDAPTSEAIVAAEFIKDTLVVYFERSTYRLTYSGNLIQPFIWEKINTEIGAESTFSIVPFDKNILSVGSNGIYACNSIDIERMDRIIPDEVFNFNNANQGTKRVHGIRNFFAEMAYWTYTDSMTDGTFPNRMLVYNYLTGSFSIFTTSFTCFGQFNSLANLTWGAANHPFSYYNYTWGSFFNQSGVPLVISGNQQGFVFLLQETDGTPISQNDTTYVIQNISNANPSVFTSPNHNFAVPEDDTDPAEDEFILLQGINGGAQSLALNGEIFKVETIPTTNTFTLIDSTGTAVSVNDYTFGGFIIPVDNFNITTKNINPFFPQGQSIRLGYTDLYLDNASSSITIETYNGDIENPPIETLSISIQDTVDTIAKDPFWKRVYFSTVGPFIALKFNYSEAQMFELDLNDEPLVIHGMIFYIRPSGRSISVRNG